MTENRFTGTNHDYIRDDSHAFILREPSRCIDCGRCANVCKEVVGAACYDFMRTGFDTLVTTPLDMSLNTTPCVSCGRCAETCPTGALMPKPRVLEKYEVDESRCILCGICVDACPYDALRCGPDFELSHESRAEPMIDLLAISVDRPRHRDHRRSARSATGWSGRRQQGRNDRARADAADAARRHRRQRHTPATATRGNGHEPTHRSQAGRRPRRGRSRRRDRRSRRLASRRRALDGLGPATTVPFLNWAWDDLLFLILAGIMLAAAMFVVIGRDIVRSGLAMMLAFAALAGIYALAGAIVVAAAQVLIYIGAISVLILPSVEQVPCELRHPDFVRVTGDAGDRHGARFSFMTKKTLVPDQAAEGQHFDGERVGGRETVPMRGEKRLPRRVRAALRGRRDATVLEDRLDCVPGDLVAKALQPTADAGVAPGRILVRHPYHKRSDV